MQPYQKDWDAGPKMAKFPDPLFAQLAPVFKIKTRILLKSTHLFLNVLKGHSVTHLEADEKDVGIGIAQRAQPVIIFLTGRVPKCELDSLTSNTNLGDIVLENSRYIDLRILHINNDLHDEETTYFRETSFRKGIKQTCLDDSI